VVLVVVALIGTTAIGFGDDTPAPEPVMASKQSMQRVTTTTVPVELTDQELAAEFGDAVFRVEVDGCGYEGSGTAFAVGERHLVTNWHVVVIDGAPTVRSRDGTERRGRVVGATSDPDIAVIELDEPVDTVLEWADTASLSEGQHLVGFGYPVPGTEFGVAPGTILSFQTGPGGREAIRTDAALDRGNSGGPALTSTGQVAGVVTEMAVNLDGFQTIPLAFTHAALQPTIDAMVSSPSEFVADCDEVESLFEMPEDWEDHGDGGWSYGEYFDDPANPVPGRRPPPQAYTPPGYGPSSTTRTACEGLDTGCPSS
jgi:S1-C subfamily serine protease